MRFLPKLPPEDSCPKALTIISAFVNQLKPDINPYNAKQKMDKMWNEKPLPPAICFQPPARAQGRSDLDALIYLLPGLPKPCYLLLLNQPEVFELGKKLGMWCVNQTEHCPLSCEH